MTPAAVSSQLRTLWLAAKMAGSVIHYPKLSPAAHGRRSGPRREDVAVSGMSEAFATPGSAVGPVPSDVERVVNHAPRPDNLCTALRKYHEFVNEHRRILEESLREPESLSKAFTKAGVLHAGEAPVLSEPESLAFGSFLLNWAADIAKDDDGDALARSVFAHIFCWTLGHSQLLYFNSGLPCEPNDSDAAEHVLSEHIAPLHEHLLAALASLEPTGMDRDAKVTEELSVGPFPVGISEAHATIPIVDGVHTGATKTASESPDKGGAETGADLSEPRISGGRHPARPPLGAGADPAPPTDDPKPPPASTLPFRPGERKERTKHENRRKELDPDGKVVGQSAATWRMFQNHPCLVSDC